jgi:hypothetical protein
MFLSFRRSASERNPLTLHASFSTQSVEGNYVPTQSVGTKIA